MHSQEQYVHEILTLLEMDDYPDNYQEHFESLVQLFRQPQQRTIIKYLKMLDPTIRHENANYFNKILDTKEQVVMYLSDCLKTYRYLNFHISDTSLCKRLFKVYGCLAAHRERQILASIFQGFHSSNTALVYCEAIEKLNHLELRDNLKVLNPRVVAGLQSWLLWIHTTNVNIGATASLKTAMQYASKILCCKSTSLWLQLFHSVSVADRFLIIKRMNEAQLSPYCLDKLAEFLYQSNTKVEDLKELCNEIWAHFSYLLESFEITCFHQIIKLFNKDQFIKCVIQGLEKLPRMELHRLIEILDAVYVYREDQYSKRAVNCISVPVNLAQFTLSSLFPTVAYPKALEFSYFITNFNLKSQTSILSLLCRVAYYADDTMDAILNNSFSSAEQSEVDLMLATEYVPLILSESTSSHSRMLPLRVVQYSWFILDFFLRVPFESFELVVENLNALPISGESSLVFIMADPRTSKGDVIQLSKVFKHIDEKCLHDFLSLFIRWESTDDRLLLMKWASDISDERSQQVYNVLKSLSDSNRHVDAIKILEFLTNLRRNDQELLYTTLLQRNLDFSIGTGAEFYTNMHVEVETELTLNVTILTYISSIPITMDASKMIRLLAGTKPNQYHDLIFILQSRQQTDQELILNFMVQFPPNVVSRIISRLRSLVSLEDQVSNINIWDQDFEMSPINAFFQLLVSIPQTEYKELILVLISQSITDKQIGKFLQCANNMKNQGSARELVRYMAELPKSSRVDFLKIIESGEDISFILRIIQYTSNFSQPLTTRVLNLYSRLGGVTPRSHLLECTHILASEVITNNFIRIFESLSEFSTTQVNLLEVCIGLSNSTITLLIKCLQSLSIDEQRLTVAALFKMPKQDRLNLLSDTLSLTILDIQKQNEPAVPPATTFLQILGVLMVDHIEPLLVYFKQNKYSHLLSVFKSCMSDDKSCISSEENTRTPNYTDLIQRYTKTSMVINRIARSFIMLDREDMLLFEQICKMLTKRSNLAMLVSDFCTVLEHFETPPLLRDFLELSAKLRCIKGLVVRLVQVFAQVQHPSLLMEVCTIADFDDAAFLIRRLHQILSHEDPNSSKYRDFTIRLASISQQFEATKNVFAVKDDFCTLIAGFSLRDISLKANYMMKTSSSTDVINIDAHHQNVNSSSIVNEKKTVQEQSATNDTNCMNQAEELELGIYYNSVSKRPKKIFHLAPSLQRRHKYCTDDELLQVQKIPYKALYSRQEPCNAADIQDPNTHNPSIRNNDEQIRETDVFVDFSTCEDPSFNEVSYSDTNVTSSKIACDTQEIIVRDCNSSHSGLDSTQSRLDDMHETIARNGMYSYDLLPPTSASDQSTDDPILHRPKFIVRNRQHAENEIVSPAQNIVNTLGRCESAPQLNYEYRSPLPLEKLQRGLASALGIDKSSPNSDRTQIARERSASIFLKQIDPHKSATSSRIQVSKSPEAKIRRNTVLVDRALGLSSHKKCPQC